MGVRPFSNGTEFTDWLEGNCERCKKGAGYSGEWPTCPIEDALTYAMFDDGTIDDAIADRIGPGEGIRRIAARCGEWEKKG